MELERRRPWKSRWLGRRRVSRSPAVRKHREERSEVSQGYFVVEQKQFREGNSGEAELVLLDPPSLQILPDQNLGINI